MNRTPRGEGGTGSLQSAPKKVVAILQRSVSWQRGRRGKGTIAAQQDEAQSPTLGPQQSGPPAPPPPQAAPILPSDEEPPSQELPVELNERGVPLLTSLPEILEALSPSPSAETPPSV